MRKKSKDASVSVVEKPSEDAGRPSLSSFPFMRNKKSKQEPKPQLDLANALPASDEFRTSLLMPNLSARFSMLREQDDPNSKIGKAADDSVLFPRRTSRLNMLSDIAEAESIKGSFRPPFAEGRTNSYASADGYGTDDDSTQNGSIMHRSRPGEGNNLFGGRQKIYKIPATGSASARNLTSTSTKFIYENDVSLSAFQKLREKEREQELEQALDREREEDELHQRFNAHPNSRVPSPPLLGYNRNRETSSSTTSGPSFGRISTAATSIASQGGMSVYGNPALALPHGHPSAVSGVERSATKSRRLYEPGLDQHLHDQQSSSMTRLDLITRQRTGSASTPPPGQYSSLSQANSITNLHERYERGAVSRSPSSRMRAASPPPSAPSSNFGSFQFGINETKSAGASPHLGYIHSPPLSPPHSEGEDNSVLPAAIHPTDRGKATAMGTFNKPVGAFDDQKYSQRQLQLQQGRDTPPPRAFPALPEETTPSMHSASLGHRSGANSRQGSASTTHSSHRHAQIMSGELSPVSPSASPELSNAHLGTFLAAASNSDVSSDDEGEPEGARPVHNHAALQHIQEDASEREEATMTTGAARKLSEPEWMHRDAVPKALAVASAQSSAPTDPKRNDPTMQRLQGSDADSPTLGPSDDLSGLVRQHLRNDSGSSSVYDTPSPVHMTFPTDVPGQSYRRRSRLNEEATHAPDEARPGETYDGGFVGEEEVEGGPKSPSPTQSDGSSRRRVTVNPGTTLGDLAHAEQYGHARGPSTETQKERQEFADELAHRRQAVLENLKVADGADGVNGHAAPGTASSGPREGTKRMGNTFNMLKGKTSRDSLKGKAESAPKALKMLGISSSESPTKKSNSDRWKEEEEKMLRSIVRGPKMPSPPRGPHAHPQNMRREQGPPQERRDVGPNGPLPNGPPRSPPRYLDAARAQHKARGGRDRGEGRMGGPPRRGQPHDGTMVAGHGPAPNGAPRPEFQERPQGSRNPSPPLNPGSRAAPPHQTVGMSPYNSAPRPAPIATFSANNTPSLGGADSNGAHGREVTSPTGGVREGVQIPHHAPTHRRRAVNKADISEPTFISCTSNIVTISLPAGATLANGANEASGSAPPLPPINPRRRMMATHAVNQLLGRGNKTETSPPGSVAVRSMSEEHSSFSDEADGGPKWQRHKLKKSSSDGGDLKFRARQQPTTTTSTGTLMPAAGHPVDGSMF